MRLVPLCMNVVQQIFCEGFQFLPQSLEEVDPVLAVDLSLEHDEQLPAPEDVL